jgi:hypothetical protein
LTAHRRDLIADRVRLVNRMRDLLCGISPALEKAFCQRLLNFDPFRTPEI